uniref:Uncharacterized protein n=1 Tax=Glossina austeni TaxID=7395 RepID=A0A1A9V4W9_GLOAU
MAKEAKRKSLTGNCKQPRSQESEYNSSMSPNNHNTIKMLGPAWLPREDAVCINVISSERSKMIISIISDVASIFDALGLLRPVVVATKIMIQELKLQNNKSIPRHVLHKSNKNAIQRHNFVDVPLGQNLDERSAVTSSLPSICWEDTLPKLSGLASVSSMNFSPGTGQAKMGAVHKSHKSAVLNQPAVVSLSAGSELAVIATRKDLAYSYKKFWSREVNNSFIYYESRSSHNFKGRVSINDAKVAVQSFQLSLRHSGMMIQQKYGIKQICHQFFGVEPVV